MPLCACANCVLLLLQIHMLRQHFFTACCIPARPPWECTQHSQNRQTAKSTPHRQNMRRPSVQGIVMPQARVRRCCWSCSRPPPRCAVMMQTIILYRAAAGACAAPLLELFKAATAPCAAADTATPLPSPKAAAGSQEESSWPGIAESGFQQRLHGSAPLL